MRRRTGAFGFMTLAEMLAKSDGTTLLEHTRLSLETFRSIRECYSDLDKIEGTDRFWELLFVSLFLHDVGKCARGFQAALKGDKPWGYRHEILSAGFVSCLSGYNDLERTGIALAIIGHHKDLREIGEKFGTHVPTGRENYEMRLAELALNFEEITEMLRLFPRISAEYFAKSLNNVRIPDSVDVLVDAYREIVLPKYVWPAEDGNLTPLHGSLGIFLKGFCTACDHLASAGKSEILKAIPDIRAMYNFPTLREIQVRAMNQKGDLILMAPTGIGKTEAALLWTGQNQNSLHSRRVYYVLPFIASINAMFRRLSRDFKNDEIVGLQHGKAQYFLYRSLSDDGCYESKSAKVRSISDLTAKIYRPYKILTPFQVLKPFFGIRGFEQQMAEMAHGLFVFDEIHAYDAHTTALIIEMMKILKNDFLSNLLIMSATMPTFLKELLKRELGIENEIGMTPQKLRRFTRHRVEMLGGELPEAIDRICRTLENGKRVLVVCNTVQRAQDVYERLIDVADKSVLLHGRFMLRDRERIESMLGAVNLLVGTQAIEVSLDISFDVLFSEPAPLDALIQRFGRVNRRGWEDGHIAPVYVFERGSTNDAFIYDPILVDKSTDLLHDVDVLDEGIIADSLDGVYGRGYVGKPAEDFAKVRSHFTDFVKDNLPFMENPEREDQFYSLFRSYEVVPLQYKLDYLAELDSGRHLEAMRYFVDMSVIQFQRLKREGRVTIDRDTLFVDTPYSPEIGLMSDRRIESIL